MQTILGANGVIARELAIELATTYTKDIRLVSRHPQKVNDTDQLLSADLLDKEQVIRACEGSEVVYLTAGLKYDHKVWAAQWPLIIENVIEGCRKAGARLVFFSNVYALGEVHGWMTEQTPMNPCSKKGKIRASIEKSLLEEMQKGIIPVIIARAPDFYGPDSKNSVAQMMVFDNLSKGKKPQWLVNAKTKHSLIYTPDAGKATAILGNTPSAFNRIWNLPTAKDPLTGEAFIAKAAKAFGRPASYTVLPTWMLVMAGWFTPDIKGVIEMLYQQRIDYLFDSSDFEKAFGFTPTTYDEGIKQVRAAYPQAD
jgi:nucleoside-diphosphate-sugar epimerase